MTMQKLKSPMFHDHGVNFLEAAVTVAQSRRLESKVRTLTICQTNHGCRRVAGNAETRTVGRWSAASESTS